MQISTVFIGGAAWLIVALILYSVVLTGYQGLSVFELKKMVDELEKEKERIISKVDLMALNAADIETMDSEQDAQHTQQQDAEVLLKGKSCGGKQTEM